MGRCGAFSRPEPLGPGLATSSLTGTSTSVHQQASVIPIDDQEMDNGSLRSKASQETFISLLNLEPAPMETPPPDVDKDLPPVPEEGSATSGSKSLTDSTTSKSTSSLGLSGSGHGAIYYCPSDRGEMLLSKLQSADCLQCRVSNVTRPTPSPFSRLST